LYPWDPENNDLKKCVGRGGGGWTNEECTIYQTYQDHKIQAVWRNCEKLT
jgi:hypothetical protein